MINESVLVNLKGNVPQENNRKQYNDICDIGVVDRCRNIHEQKVSDVEERELFKSTSKGSIDVSWKCEKTRPRPETWGSILDHTLVSLPKKYLQNVKDGGLLYLEERDCMRIFDFGENLWINDGKNGSEPVQMRPTTTTNWLKPLMTFQGYQISGYKKYQVQVHLQTVEFPATQYISVTTTPHLTGFLTIRGLTSHYAKITTFFEAFAVSDTIGFMSSNIPQELFDYKSTDRVDLEHWLNFPSFKEFLMMNDSNTMSDIMEGTYIYHDYLSRRYIFMRWKEKFLVPEDKAENVEGASYDGYYYIVHDQITGNILGFYYHKEAEKFQQLELTPVHQVKRGVCRFEFT